MMRMNAGDQAKQEERMRQATEDAKALKRDQELYQEQWKKIGGAETLEGWLRPMNNIKPQ